MGTTQKSLSLAILINILRKESAHKTFLEKKLIEKNSLF